MNDADFIEHFDIMNSCIANVEKKLSERPNVKYCSLDPIYYNSTSGFYVLYTLGNDNPKIPNHNFSAYVIGTGHVWTEKRLNLERDSAFSGVVETNDRITLRLEYPPLSESFVLEEIVFDKNKIKARSAEEAVFGVEITDVEIK